MTEGEFEAELRRLGFRPTAMTAGLQRRWVHVTGVVRWLMEAPYLLPEKRPGYINTVRRSIGL